MSREWNTVWKTPGERLVVQSTPEEGWTRYRTSTSTEADGAVAIAVHEGRTLFLDIDRPAVGQRLWELPRGQGERSDESPVFTAARELREETGIVVTGGQNLGKIFAESGLNADATHVVSFEVTSLEITGTPEHEHLLWLDDEQIRDAIRSGRIRDGISLAALGVARAQ